MSQLILKVFPGEEAEAVNFPFKRMTHLVHWEDLEGSGGEGGGRGDWDGEHM